jgi:polyisoprenoid-binding protein YceI
VVDAVNSNRVYMPANVKGHKKGHVALLEIVSNERWKEYNMKYRAITFAFAVVSSLAFANDIWTLDSSTSNARLFQGAKATPGSVNTGVARVTGKVTVDTNDPDNSIFNLSIYPADEDWGRALNPEGALPTDYVPDATDQTMLTFKSTRIVRTGNGRLEVIGDLTLTRVERTITAAPTEAYAGPVYGDPVLRSDTREIRFLFPSLSAGFLPGSLTPVMLKNEDALEIVGAARVGHEDFPELLGAIRETNWPSVIQNKHCHMPSTVGEDYSGVQCTGTLIAATSYDNCQMASAGEDYSGPVCTPATGNQTTIILDLKLLHTMLEPSAGVLSGNPGTR